MNKLFTGALNSAGFGASLKNNRLPTHTHLTYEGIFSELRYDVGAKTDKVLDLHHQYARFQFEQSMFDRQIHDYLALYLKGRADGQSREENRRLNSVICLDISGSMNILIDSSQGKKSHTRLSLCKEAIKIFISKLRPQDSVGMTTFDGQAHLIFDPIQKKGLSEDIYERIDSIAANGSNQLMDGFNLSKSLLLKEMKKCLDPNIQNRIIILSDVQDDSIHKGIEAIKKTASEDGINLTIVGISDRFNSKACEELKNTKGFNYFSAVCEEDLLKYLFETFDYSFFPSANNIQIIMEADNVERIEVFGVPDSGHSEVQPFQEEQTNKGGLFMVTRIKSSFPSEIEIDKETTYTAGGLILVKIYRKERTPCFKGGIRLTYENIEGKTYSQEYKLDYSFHPEEQFLSTQALDQAMKAFIFTSEMKKILVDVQSMKKQEIYSTYYQMICKMQGLCPKKKQAEYNRIKQILEDMNIQYPPPLTKQSNELLTVGYPSK